jgi:hypothetical protein
MRKHVTIGKRLLITFMALAALMGCSRQETAGLRPAVDLHTAAAQGNLEAVRQHIAAGTKLNEPDPFGGSTPLITAAAFGQTEAARLLIDAGADLNSKNNDGSTALMTAAFLCRTEIVELLLQAGADKSIRNNAGATPLEAVSGPWDELKPVYELVAATLGPMGLEVDYARIKATRPRIAELLR